MYCQAKDLSLGVKIGSNDTDPCGLEVQSRVSVEGEGGKNNDDSKSRCHLLRTY